MPYEDLLNRGLIKPFAAGKAQFASRLALAKRDIKAAEAMLAIDRDWAFSMAYNAVLQATRALMFANGFRPAAGEGPRAHREDGGRSAPDGPLRHSGGGGGRGGIPLLAASELGHGRLHPGGRSAGSRVLITEAASQAPRTGRSGR